MAQVLILAGRGPGYGSGHFTRMTRLQAALLEREIDSDIFPLEIGDSFLERSSDSPALKSNQNLRLAGNEFMNLAFERSLVLLDVRDLDPGPLLLSHQGPIIALDNRCAQRKKRTEQGILFRDTLPHPAANLRDCLRRALIEPELLAFRQTLRAAEDAGVEPESDVPRPVCGHALVYAGGLSGRPRKILDRTLALLLEQGLLRSVLRVGGDAPDEGLASSFEWRQRLKSEQFQLELLRSEFCFAYPGQALLEAWFLGALPILFDIPGPDHKPLARFLSREAGLLYLEGDSPAERARTFADSLSDVRGNLKNHPGPTGEGFGLLLDEISAFVPAQEFRDS